VHDEATLVVTGGYAVCLLDLYLPFRDPLRNGELEAALGVTDGIF
jgi:hypothetical protein